MSKIHSIPTVSFCTEDVDVVFNHDHTCQEGLKSKAIPILEGDYRLVDKHIQEELSRIFQVDRGGIHTTKMEIT